MNPRSLLEDGFPVFLSKVVEMFFLYFLEHFHELLYRRISIVFHFHFIDRTTLNTLPQS